MFGKKEPEKKVPTAYVVEVYLDNFIDRGYEMPDGTYVKIGRHAWGWMIQKFYGEKQILEYPVIYSETSHGFDTAEEAERDLLENLERIQREDGYRA